MSDEPALPWFPFYAADFTNSKKVRLMTPEEVGVYTLLLAHQWQTGPIDLPPDRLGMFTQGADPNAVAAVLERCFIETDEGWVNERLEEVRQEQVEKRQQKVRAGKASAKARRRKRLEKATALEQRSSSVATERQQKANNTESESEADTETEVETTGDAGASLSSGAPVDAMHEAFCDVLGGDPPHPTLTAKRRDKYRALWDEHLADLDDWRPVWRALLLAITDSSHHMSQRAYQMPESFLRNEERRDTWMQKAADRISGRPEMTEGDRKLLQFRRKIEDVPLEEIA